MRKQIRPAEPAILIEHGTRWTQQWIELRKRNPAAQFSWYVVNGEPANVLLMPFLRDMTQEHCAFCDAFPFSDRSPETIEHFRPKSLFPEVAYHWVNLYYCCARCQGEKGGQWDDRLLSPDAPDYSFERYFFFEFTTGALRPNPQATKEDQDRARETIRIYNLDEPKRKARKLVMRDWRNDPAKNIDEFGYRDCLT